MAMSRFHSLGLGSVIALILVATCGAAPVGVSEMMTRTIYQVMVDRFATTTNAPTPDCSDGWCGGTLAGVQNKLDYIQALGADAIAISPVSASDAWHGFSPLDLYRVDEHLGTADDLRALVSAAHASNMLVLITVQFNHMGGSEQSIPTYGAPFNNTRWYHDCRGCGPDCRITNYSYFAPQLEHCRLGGMPDLNQGRSLVRQALRQWANWLATEYAVDGLLVDMVKYVNASFFPLINTSQRFKTYVLGDISVEDTSILVDNAQRFDSLLAYPLHAALRSVFERGVSMRYLASVADEMHQVPASPYVLSLERLRGDRFLHNQPDKALYRNALAFVLLEGGIPMLLYGEEQALDAAAQGGFGFATPPLWNTGYSTVSEPFTFIAAINAHRKSTGLSSNNAMLRHPYRPVYVDDTVLVFQRGPTLVVLSNAGSAAAPKTLELASPALDSTFIYPEDAMCDIVTKQAATINGRPVVVGGELGSPTVTLQVFGEPLMLCACYIVNQTP